MKNKDKETMKNAKAKATHVSIAKGSANEKKLGGAFCGFLKSMLIPEIKTKFQ